MITDLVIFKFFIILARIGFSINFLPCTGERYFFTRIKLIFSIFISIAMYPILSKTIPNTSDNMSHFIRYIILESCFGFLIAIVSKIYFVALDLVGQIIAMQSGLSAATFFDANQQEQTQIFSSMFHLMGVMAIFASDAHYILINGIIESYDKFPIGQTPIFDDIASLVTQIFNDSMSVAFKISAPFLVVNIASQAGAGILARLMPNLQVFFIITPLQIVLTFGILMITINDMMAEIVKKIIVI